MTDLAIDWDSLTDGETEYTERELRNREVKPVPAKILTDAKAAQDAGKRGVFRHTNPDVVKAYAEHMRNAGDHLEPKATMRVSAPVLDEKTGKHVVRFTAGKRKAKKSDETPTAPAE